MKIFIASDHAGFELKQHLVARLAQKGIETVDLGPDAPDRCDYPDYARAVARAVADDADARGVLVCGTGIGMSMAANKVKGIRAAVVHDAFTAEVARSHNDSNVLCLGARVIEPSAADELLDLWLTTPFEGGRHAERVDKIMKLDACGE